MNSKLHSMKLRIKLNGIKPEIWRSVVVEDSLTLQDLHNVIQAAMGWGNCHMYEFEIAGIRYGIPDDDGFDEHEIENAKKVKLSKLKLTEKEKFEYIYDFGDDWNHTIKIEKILPGESPYDGPFCIEGARNCPPEDCGSIPGYEDIVEAMKNTKSKKAKEFIDWLGEPYDAEHFDIEEINTRLKHALPKKKKGGLR
ncbi:MAG: plasmid pRiA4b ORF-3 family protein [Fibrobacter sp.]|nr:plasmid pRiA4b ORF-3 family protein [Fibrobacter sp.]